jgi:hypothetical protein
MALKSRYGESDRGQFSVLRCSRTEVRSAPVLENRPYPTHHNGFSTREMKLYGTIVIDGGTTTTAGGRGA